MRKVFFVDFDGTITRQDTCTAMVQAFAREGWQELNELWEKKELSTEECAKRTLELFCAAPGDVAKLMDNMEIDAYFMDFLKLCRSQNDQVYILSDGYDFNIQTILHKYNIDVPYYANRLIYANGFKIECPHFNETCGMCGTCKTSLMSTLAGHECQTIYIGDGYSDTCPATHADIVYAKDTLYQFCSENQIDAVPFKTFQDIIRSLTIGGCD